MEIKELKRIVREIKAASHGLHTTGARLGGILHDNFTSYLTKAASEIEKKAKRMEVLLKQVENEIKKKDLK